MVFLKVFLLAIFAFLSKVKYFMWMYVLKGYAGKW